MGIEPIKRAHSPLLAAGLASVYKISIIPYGRRFPAACSLLQGLQYNQANTRHAVYDGILDTLGF